MKLMNGMDVLCNSTNITYDSALRGWVTDAGVFTDPDRLFSISTGIVSPVEFKLLFTSQERLAIKTARLTDPIVDDFMSLIEDPRLTHVDLSLQSTLDALNYLVDIELLTPERKAEIVEGKIK